MYSVFFLSETYQTVFPEIQSFQSMRKYSNSKEASLINIW
jgi:hypothetical protein